MNKFDRAISKKMKELIEKNVPHNEVDEETIKKYTTIARAMLKEEARGVKPNANPKSLYRKTWKAAEKYGEFKK